MSDDRKTVILTGASRGIGHATVKRFSSEGWRIITCSREAVPEECQRDPNWTDHVSVDLNAPESVEDFIVQANEILGERPLHGLVNNAAVSPFQKRRTRQRLRILRQASASMRPSSFSGATNS